MRGSRDGWPRAEFFHCLDRLIAESPYPHQSAVAEAAGLNPSNISVWRHGRTRPTRESLTAIARILNVPELVLWEAAGYQAPGADSPAIELATALRTVTANLNSYIQARAHELAQPIIAAAQAEADERVREAEFKTNRQVALIDELGRHVALLERQLERARKAGFR